MIPQKYVVTSHTDCILRDLSLPPKLGVKDLRWRRWKPGLGSHTLNIGILSSDDLYSAGVVVRDQQGEVVRAFSLHLPNADPFHNLVTVIKHEMSHSIASSDVITCIQSAAPDMSLLIPHCPDVISWNALPARNDLFAQFPSVVFKKVCRLIENTPALILASHSIENHDPMSITSFMLAITRDKFGLGHLCFHCRFTDAHLSISMRNRHAHTTIFPSICAVNASSNTFVTSKTFPPIFSAAPKILPKNCAVKSPYAKIAGSDDPTSPSPPPPAPPPPPPTASNSSRATADSNLCISFSSIANQI